MAPWLNGRDLLERWNTNRGYLAYMILEGKLEVYKPGGASFEAIDIARKSKEQKEAETKEYVERSCLKIPKKEELCQTHEQDKCFLDGPRNDIGLLAKILVEEQPDDHFLNLPEKCLDEILYYSCHSRWMEDNFLEGVSGIIGGSPLERPRRASKLISILKDVESNFIIQYEALRAVLPFLLFSRVNVEAWEAQRIASQKIKQISAKSSDKESKLKGGAPKGHLAEAVEHAYLKFLKEGNTEIIRKGKIREFLERFKEMTENGNRNFSDYVAERILAVKITPSRITITTQEQSIKPGVYRKSHTYCQTAVSKQLTILREKNP